MTVTAAELARTIDHTLIKPEATPDQIDMLCDEALQYGFHAVCVNPVYVARAVRRLAGSKGGDAGTIGPVVVSVAGFPLGASATKTKVDEASRALGEGASEIDTVIALGALIAGDQAAVVKDIAAVAEAVHAGAKDDILKVILETAALGDGQIALGCRCSVEGRADFVKTSTGFHPFGGATVEHVRLLCHHASPLRVKASGGIRTAAAACGMLAAGASRLGTSSGVAIIQELRGQLA